MQVASIYYTKLWEKVADFLGETIFLKRKNWIKQKDYVNSKKILKKGDIILVGVYNTIMGFVTKERIVNHSIYYTGDEKIIHSLSGGVQKNSLKWMCSYYDTFIVLRNNQINSKSANEIDCFINKQLGKDYNYQFYLQKKNYTCTQLIIEAYNHSKIMTGCKSFNEKNKLIKKYLPFLTALNPIDLVNNKNFKIVFMTSNLSISNNNLQLTLPNNIKAKLNWLSLKNQKIRLL